MRRSPRDHQAIPAKTFTGEREDGSQFGENQRISPALPSSCNALAFGGTGGVARRVIGRRFPPRPSQENGRTGASSVKTKGFLPPSRPPVTLLPLGAPEASLAA